MVFRSLKSRIRLKCNKKKTDQRAMRSASVVIKRCVCSEVESAAIQHLSYLRIGMPFSKHFAFITKPWICFWRPDCSWDLSVWTLCAKRKRMFANPSGQVRFANKANKNVAPGVKEVADFTFHWLTDGLWAKECSPLGIPECKATEIVLLRGW